MIAAASDIFLINRREAPHFLMCLSSVFDKKVGDFNKKESEGLGFTGLEIPRDYYIVLEN